MSDREQINRAAKAQALLNDPELIAAFEGVRQALHERIEAAPIRDRDGVHELKLQLKLLADVRANLLAVVNTGKVIEHRTSLLERAKQGLKQWT
jgi:hypothetical protein